MTGYRMFIIRRRNITVIIIVLSMSIDTTFEIPILLIDIYNIWISKHINKLKIKDNPTNYSCHKLRRYLCSNYRIMFFSFCCKTNMKELKCKQQCYN